VRARPRATAWGKSPLHRGMNMKIFGERQLGVPDSKHSKGLQQSIFLRSPPCAPHARTQDFPHLTPSSGEPQHSTAKLYFRMGAALRCKVLKAVPPSRAASDAACRSVSPTMRALERARRVQNCVSCGGVGVESVRRSSLQKSAVKFPRNLLGMTSPVIGGLNSEF
jgi:hypothetical protein